MTEATIAVDAVNAGVTVSAAVAESVLAIDVGDFAKDGPAEEQKMAAASDNHPVLDVALEQDEFNSAAYQMDAALATYAAIAESATVSDMAGYALTTPAAVIEAAMATDASAGPRTRTAVA